MLSSNQQVWLGGRSPKFAIASFHFLLFQTFYICHEKQFTFSYDKASVDEANSPDADNLKSEKGKTKKKKMTKKESQTRLKGKSILVLFS